MVREVELIYSEVISNSEVVLVFQTIFNRKPYGTSVTLNTGLPVKIQDEKITEAVNQLIYMDRNDAAFSESP